MLCPNQDRTRLLKEQTESLEVATPRRQNRNRTILLDPKVYKNERHETVCRNGGHVGHNAEHSRESRQDRVQGGGASLKGVSKQFHRRQTFFLQMTNNRLNGTDWTKQLISRILQITHSQWIYRNISLHDKSNGYLRNKTAEELAEEIHRLAKLQLEDLPTESKKFFQKLTQVN